MQSYLQYRRLGNTLRSQLGHPPADRHNASPRDETELSAARLGRPDASKASTENIGHASSAPSTKSPERRRSQGSAETALAQTLAGVDVQKQLESKNQPAHLFIVGWKGENDPQNPRNYSFSSRLTATLLVSALGWVVGAASSINSAVLPQTTQAFHVSDVVGSLDTGISFILKPF